MVHCVMMQTEMEVDFTGDDFFEDLEKFRKAVDRKDRVYISEKRVWRLRNPQKYLSIPYVKNAWDSRKKQLELI